jgi:hypothetical protein
MSVLIIVLLASCTQNLPPSTLVSVRECVKRNTGWHRDEFMKSYVANVMIADSISLFDDSVRIYHLKGDKIDLTEPVVIYDRNHITKCISLLVCSISENIWG